MSWKEAGGVSVIDSPWWPLCGVRLAAGSAVKLVDGPGLRVPWGAGTAGFSVADGAGTVVTSASFCVTVTPGMRFNPSPVNYIHRVNFGVTTHNTSKSLGNVVFLGKVEHLLPKITS